MSKFLWHKLTASFNSGASTQLWVKIGFEFDSSVNYGGPAIDDINVRPE